MFAREAKVQGLKSRAAFKLLEVRPCVSDCSLEIRLLTLAFPLKMDAKYKIFKKGAVVVDLVRAVTLDATL